MSTITSVKLLCIEMTLRSALETKDECYYFVTLKETNLHWFFA